MLALNLWKVTLYKKFFFTLCFRLFFCFFFVCILILVFLFSLLMPERRDGRAKKKRGSWTGRREEKKTCYGHFGWPFLQCWMFLSAFFCFYVCNFNLWWSESGGWKRGKRKMWEWRRCCVDNYSWCNYDTSWSSTSWMGSFCSPSPSPCISDVQRVKLSLSNCIISVESL